MGDNGYAYEPIEIQCPICESREYCIEDYYEEKEWITTKMQCIQCGSIYQTIYRAIELNLVKRGISEVTVH